MIIDCHNIANIIDTGNTNYSDQNKLHQLQKQYIKQYERFNRILDFIRESKNADFIHNETNNTLSLKHDSTNTDISLQKPIYVSHKDISNTLQTCLDEMMIEYEFLKKRILYGTYNEMSLKENLDKLYELTNEITVMLKSKTNLQNLHKTYTKILEEEIIIIKNKINKIQTSELEKRNDILNKEDKLSRKHEIHSALSFIDESKFKLKDHLEQEHRLQQLLDTSDYSYLISIDKLNENVHSNTLQNDVEIKEPKKKIPKDRVEEKIKKKINKSQKKHLTPTFQDEQIENRNKQDLKKLLFANLQDCISNKRTAKTYMSKENIIKIIEESPSLKSKMPKGYKTLKKQSICESIFGE